MTDNTVFSGKSGSILVGVEASYGAGGTPSKTLGYISAARIETSEDFEPIDPIGTRDTQYNVRTRWRIKGSIDAHYQHGRILEYVIGSATHAGASDPYTHTFHEVDVIPSLVLQGTKSFTAAGLKNTIVGVKCNSLRLTADKGAPMKWSAEWVGQSNTMAATTASQTLDTIIPPTPAQVAVFTGATGADPTDELPGVQSFEVSINNNLAPFDAISSVIISDLVEGRRKYTGKVSFAASNNAEVLKQVRLMLGSATLLTVQDTQDRRAIKLYWTNGLTPEDNFTMTLYGCTFDSMTDPYEKDGIMYFDMPFKAESLGALTTKDGISDTSW